MEDAHGLNYRLVIFPILRWNQEDSLRHVGRHFDTKGKLESEFPFPLRFQSWHVQIIYVGEINAKIIEKDLVNTLKIWIHFQFLLYATIVP